MGASLLALAKSIYYMNGAVRKSYNKLEPDSDKVKNNSPQFNVSLYVRLILFVCLFLCLC